MRQGRFVSLFLRTSIALTMASIANDDAVAEEQEKGRGKKKKSRRNKKKKDESSSTKNLSFKEKQELRKKAAEGKEAVKSNDAICAVNLGTLVSSVLASRMVVAVSQGIVQKVKDQKFLRLIKRKIGGRKNVPARLILKVTK